MSQPSEVKNKDGIVMLWRKTRGQVYSIEWNCTRGEEGEVREHSIS